MSQSLFPVLRRSPQHGFRFRLLVTSFFFITLCHRLVSRRPKFIRSSCKTFTWFFVYCSRVKWEIMIVMQRVHEESIGRYRAAVEPVFRVPSRQILRDFRFLKSIFAQPWNRINLHGMTCHFINWVTLR